MDRPLISHPAPETGPAPYPDHQLTDEGHLRLTAHSNEVGNRATRLFGAADDRKQVLEAAARLHDFGKATPQFQAHVRPDERYDGPDAEKNHARLGAIATWYVLGTADVPPQDRLAATLAVARHHQALPNAARYTAETLADAVGDANNVIIAQIDAIDDRWPTAADSLLSEPALGNADWAGFAAWVRSGDAAAELREHSARDTLGSYTIEPGRLPRNLYDRTIHYWAAITLADKSHAMAIPDDHLFDFDTLDRRTLEAYVESLRASPPDNEFEAQLNDERERARRQAVQGVHEWLASDDAIATLTLPTGLGKTFTGLSAAFELRDALDAAARPGPDGPTPIIYALPYTSIIEQTRAIFEDPDLWGADPEQSALTVHHYLSQTVVYHNDHDTTDVPDTDAEETAVLLGESWRDGTILTTFVQLFESLAGPGNREGLKLPALDSSVVILDEPQALPKDWWDGIERLLGLLTDEYGARVIAMTATQPSLVRDIETTSLLTAGHEHDSATCDRCAHSPTYTESLPTAPAESYFDQADRVRYTIDESALSHALDAPTRYVDHDEAASRLRTAVEETDSVLAICNTIASSRELTTAVCEGTDVTHLGPLLRQQLEAVDRSIVDESVDPTDIAAAVLDAVGIDGPPLTDRGEEGPIQESWSIPEGHGPLALTLNSRFRPFDRQVIVELASRLSTSPVPFLLVSTQAIEAGVDISFQRLYRDIAPLDSIVQAAGRCNRSYEWGVEGGDAVIWTLAPPSDDASEPPAYWVYERGATEDGIPDHLRLISEVLGELPTDEPVSDAVFSTHAVDTYFDRLAEKSLDSGAIRTEIDDGDADALARRSLIGGYPTVDVLVAVTDAETRELNHITDLFNHGDPEAYERLDDLSQLRVSVPKNVIEDSPTIARIDGAERDADGVQVFRFVGDGDLEYEVDGGGLRRGDEGVENRFTII